MWCSPQFFILLYQKMVYIARGNYKKSQEKKIKALHAWHNDNAEHGRSPSPTARRSTPAPPVCQSYPRPGGHRLHYPVFAGDSDIKRRGRVRSARSEGCGGSEGLWPERAVFWNDEAERWRPGSYLSRVRPGGEALREEAEASGQVRFERIWRLKKTAFCRPFFDYSPELNSTSFSQSILPSFLQKSFENSLTSRLKALL